MAQFKVTLEFTYDSEESTADWDNSMPHEFIDSAEKAYDSAIAELGNNNPHDFEFHVRDENDNLKTF